MREGASAVRAAAAGLAALVLALVASAAPAAAGGKGATPAAASPYVDETLCAACHPDRALSYHATRHADLARTFPGLPSQHEGCQGCHGPGRAHAEKGGGRGVGGLQTFKPSTPARERAAACLRCHQNYATHYQFSGSTHSLVGVACNDCHEPHGPKAEPLLRRPQFELCTGCHADIRAKFKLPEHHPLEEGAVRCTDCHNPHGDRNRRLLRAANNRTCFRCHADKEGPFIFEHEVVTVAGCVRCHDPHGSTNRHLLVRQQTAQLCYECHVVTPGFHTQPLFRDCTRCHVEIHGSNSDPRFFLR